MIKYFLFLFMLPLNLLSQDITGVWTGDLYNDTTKKFIRYELAISEDNGKLSGYSHTIFVIDSIQNIGVKSVKIKRSGNDFMVEDDKLIYNNYKEPPAKGVKTFSDLVLSENDSALFLQGHFKTNRTRIYQQLTGTIFLQKKKDIRQTLIIPKLDSLGLVESLSFYRPISKPSDLSMASAQIANKKENSLSNPDNPKNTNQVLKEEKREKEKLINTVEPTSENNSSIVDNDPNKKRRPKKSENKTPASEKENLQPSVVSAQANDISNKSIVKTDGVKSTSDNYSEKHQPETESVASKKEIIGNKTATKTNSVNQLGKGPARQDETKLTSQDLQKRNGGNLNTVQKFIVPPAAEVATRKVETIRSVEIKRDSLMLSLFDNGEIDGDTVSILLNGKVIMARQGLMSRAINKTIYLTPEMGDSITLIMYAENLGSIPPNTGLLVIHDGDDIFEIRFSGDLKKSSAIVLRRKQKL
ncbi:MAG: hypothetical protein ABIO82_07175 [Ginsengibacter sp.]